MASKDALKKKLEADRQADRKPVNDSKMDSMVKRPSVPTPKAKPKTKKETHKTFTAWVEKKQLASWKAYIKTKNIKSEDLALYAIQHYIDNVYPITPDEDQAYKANLAEALSSIDSDERHNR